MMRTRLAQRPSHPALRPSALAVLCLLALLWTAAPASAQPAEELKEENARLAERVRQLESELEQARRNIELLSDEIKRLRSRTGGDERTKNTETEQSGESERVDIADDPLASPRAYVHALRAGYEAEFDPIDPEDARERSRRMARLRPWISDARRAFRGPIDWTVRLDTSTGQGGIRGREAFFHYVDESTGRTLGDQFAVTLRRADLRRLADAPGDTLYRMRGLINPRLRIASDCLSEESPGEGVFIGPFAELGMDIRVDSLREE